MSRKKRDYRLISLKEAGEILGTSPKKVRQLISHGALIGINLNEGIKPDGYRLNPMWRIDTEELERFIARQTRT